MKRKVQFGLILVLLLSMVLTPARVSADGTRELSLTTAFLYNFAKYTEWPTQEERPFAFCVEKDSAVRSYMSKLATRTLRERAIEIHDVTSRESLADCDVAYFDSTSELFKRVLDADLPLLVVGRDLEAADITLFKSEDTLQFKIRLERVETKGFKFRSQLLKIAAETR